MLDFAGYRAHGVQIAGRSNGETRFDNVHAKLFDLAGKPQLLFAVHGKTGGLLTISQRGVEDVDAVHIGSLQRYQ